MLTLSLHRITAWLCLVVALITGVAPAQGFLLCVEEDGCVSVEITAASDRCGSCEAHVIEDVSSVAATPIAPDTNCPCIDFTVPNSSKAHSLLSKSTDARLLKWFAMLPASLVPCSAMTSLLLRTPAVEVPRPPDTLLSIRSVVLLV